MSEVLRKLTLEAAHQRYEEIRPRLPQIDTQGAANTADNLLATEDYYDGYLFDSFGVLNVGETAIEGAADCLTALREMGKSFCVLTNAASYTSAAALKKYKKLGLDIREGEVISSRDVMFAALNATQPRLGWAAICASDDLFEDAPSPVQNLLQDVTDWDQVEGFMFLSAAPWNDVLQDRLVASLHRRPRPVVVGNPDLVAPRETGLTIEPGFWAHDLQDRTRIDIRFFGKPYPDAFATASRRLGVERVAMVGDTLHTDILGAQTYGLDTILVTQHGLYAGQPVGDYSASSGISPTWIIPTL